MSDRTRIEWADATWNPVSGCSAVSPGCDHCYAKTLAERFRGVEGHYFEHGFDVQTRPEKLDQPLRWRRPRKIFVNSVSDLVHSAVTDDFVARVFAVMAVADHHTFLVLTKRPGRMRSLLSNPQFVELVLDKTRGFAAGRKPIAWPLPNVWLGVSAEDQKWFGVRVPVLLRTPAVVRFVSAEPLLGAITLCCCDGAAYDVRRHPFLTNPRCALHGTSRLDWVIAGGESGRHARPMHPDWARQLRDQCRVMDVAFLFKQWGQWVPSAGGSRDQWLRPDTGAMAPWQAGTISQGRPSSEAIPMRRVGKRVAGRLLDGRTWDQFPTHAGTVALDPSAVE